MAVGAALRRPPHYIVPAMGPIVVKLGSSIVADERGEVRADVLGRICDDLAALHPRGGRQSS